MCGFRLHGDGRCVRGFEPRTDGQTRTDADRGWGGCVGLRPVCVCRCQSVCPWLKKYRSKGGNCGGQEAGSAFPRVVESRATVSGPTRGFLRRRSRLSFERIRNAAVERLRSGHFQWPICDRRGLSARWSGLRPATRDCARTHQPLRMVDAWLDAVRAQLLVSGFWLLVSCFWLT